MSRGWQQKERLVASWFGCLRNPLSGRNNRADDGSKRFGDILFSKAVVEVKRRKTVDLSVGLATRALAKVAGLPWIVFEFKTARSGSAPEASMVKITCDHDTARAIGLYLSQCYKAGGIR